jgi:hypothetical protein
MEYVSSKFIEPNSPKNKIGKPPLYIDPEDIKSGETELNEVESQILESESIDKTAKNYLANLIGDARLKLSTLKDQISNQKKISPQEYLERGFAYLNSLETVEVEKRKYLGYRIKAFTLRHWVVKGGTKWWVSTASPITLQPRSQIYKFDEEKKKVPNLLITPVEEMKIEKIEDPNVIKMVTELVQDRIQEYNKQNSQPGLSSIIEHEVDSIY